MTALERVITVLEAIEVLRANAKIAAKSGDLNAYREHMEVLMQLEVSLVYESSNLVEDVKKAS